MCIAAGLNPITSGFGNDTQAFCDFGGRRETNVVDVPHLDWPGRGKAMSFGVCYKPRPGERRMQWVEYGMLPSELHPRFQLDFAARHSEAPSTQQEVVLVTIIKSLKAIRNLERRKASKLVGNDVCTLSRTRPGALVATIASPRPADWASLVGRTFHVEVGPPRPGSEYLGPVSYVLVSPPSDRMGGNARRVMLMAFGRC
mmetsp:Transcript_10731/g.36441  ORF Transcript_10731/g.36441 Transcript_10731/m.36441 type:complete len:200 (+) Transcript_10731:164-763(+)